MLRIVYDTNNIIFHSLLKLFVKQASGLLAKCIFSHDAFPHLEDIGACKEVVYYYHGGVNGEGVFY